MAGATARRSSMASSPLMSSMPSSFFIAALAPSQICFSAVTAGSSFRPLGVVSLGNSIIVSRCRAVSQSALSLSSRKP